MKDRLTPERVWEIWRYHPAAVGRMVGFRDLTDDLHGRWMQRILYGEGDYTLQAHRLSYKSSCLSVALAMWCVLHHGDNALFMRKTDADTVESIAQAKKVAENEAFRHMASVLMGQQVTLAKSTGNALTVSTYDSPRGADQLLGCGIGGSLTGKHADLIFTGEGKIDSQSLRGKVVIGVARRAKALGVPAAALVGASETDMAAAYGEGVSGVFPINPAPAVFEEVKAHCQENLRFTAANLVRFYRAVRQQKAFGTR